MSVVVFGLQYEPSMNFMELIVKGIKLDRCEQDALHAELRERYRDWLNADRETIEALLRTQFKSLSATTRFAVLVVPSGNERFKNLFLVAISAQEERKKSHDVDALELERSPTDSMRLFEQLISGNPNTVKFAKNKLAQIVETDLGRLPTLLLLGALAEHQRTSVPNSPQTKLAARQIAALEKHAVQGTISPLDLRAKPSMISRTVSRLLRKNSDDE